MVYVDNYTSSMNDWTWTGRYTKNQLWSFIRVDEPMYVNRIGIHWGGYDRGTKGRHFIAKVQPNRAAYLQGIVVRSKMISVPQGRAWRYANVTKTLLEPGTYVAGVWGDYLGRRIVSAWHGDGGSIIFTHENRSIQGRVTGDKWRQKPGVIPVRLYGDPAGRMRVRANGRWRDGNAWVRANGRWRKAETVWVKANGVWRRGN